LNGLPDSWIILLLFFFLHKTKHKKSHSLWTYLFIFFHTPYTSKQGNPISMFIIPKVQHSRALCSHFGLFWSLLLQFPMGWNNWIPQKLKSTNIILT
jgi:hypothetical protein